MMNPNQFGTMLGGGIGNMSAPVDIYKRKAAPAAPGMSGGMSNSGVSPTGTPQTDAMAAAGAAPLNIISAGGQPPMPKPHPWSAEAIIGKPPAPPQRPAWLQPPGRPAWMGGGANGQPGFVQNLLTALRARQTPTSQRDLGGLY
jgi:hypothetical protein